MQTARIEVGRTNKDRVVHTIKFSVQNLGGVFADFHPRAQHPAVEKTPCTKRDGHIGFSRHQDPDPPTTSGHPTESSTQGQSRQKVSHRDADVARLLQAFQKLSQEGVPTATRSAGQHPNAIRRARSGVHRVATTQARKAKRALVRPLPHGFKTIVQRLDHRTGQTNANVPPSGMNAITQVFRSHVKPSSDGRGPVDDQQLAVTADGQPAQRQRVENPHLAAGQSQRIKKTLIEGR